MLFKEGREFKAFAANEIRENNIKHRRDFSKILENDYVLRKNTSRGALIIGLRSTGKTMGVYQAVRNFPSDNVVLISASGREEDLAKNEVLGMLKEKDYDLIFIDEYSWLKENEDERDRLAGYLAGKAGEGVKVIITGTDSTEIHGLLNSDFIHRAIQLNTTYFSYDEYCRLYELDKNDGSMKAYLTSGGIFENHASETYGSLKEYIKTAIIENLGAYYHQYSKELMEAAVYKIFYECICKDYTKNSDKDSDSHADRNKLTYEDFLENFGIRADVQIKPYVLREIFGKLKEIGVLVTLNDIKPDNRKRTYITNQAISAQLTKCIYGLDEIPESYMEDLYEASAACFEYMQNASDKNVPH